MIFFEALNSVKGNITHVLRNTLSSTCCRLAFRFRRRSRDAQTANDRAVRNGPHAPAHGVRPSGDASPNADAALPDEPVSGDVEAVVVF